MYMYNTYTYIYIYTRISYIYICRSWSLLSPRAWKRFVQSWNKCGPNWRKSGRVASINRGSAETANDLRSDLRMITGASGYLQTSLIGIKVPPGIDRMIPKQTTYFLTQERFRHAVRWWIARTQVALCIGIIPVCLIMVMYSVLSSSHRNDNLSVDHKCRMNPFPNEPIWPQWYSTPTWWPKSGHGYALIGLLQLTLNAAGFSTSPNHRETPTSFKSRFRSTATQEWKKIKQLKLHAGEKGCLSQSGDANMCFTSFTAKDRGLLILAVWKPYLSLLMKEFPRRCRRRVCRGSRRSGISNGSWLRHLIAQE